jgi:alpha-ketoglutarate-dependent taurine dioxygenase
MTYETIGVTPMTPTIGAEISGIDLSRPLGNQQFQEVHDATAQQWIGVFHGKMPPRLVNPEAWPLYSERFTALLGFAPEPLP